MEFGWINLMGAIIVAMMMIPNIIFALKSSGAEISFRNRILEKVEQIGRFGCIILMWLPLFVWKFGFNSVLELFAYIVVNSSLLLLYLLIWRAYFRKKTKNSAMALAVIPTLIFLFSGIILRHWALIISSVFFGFGHIYITIKNHEMT